MLALTVEEGAAAGVLSKTKRQQQQCLIRPLPGQPIPSILIALQWLGSSDSLLGHCILLLDGLHWLELMRLCGSWRNEQWWTEELPGAGNEAEANV